MVSKTCLRSRYPKHALNLKLSYDTECHISVIVYVKYLYIYIILAYGCHFQINESFSDMRERVTSFKNIVLMIFVKFSPERAYYIYIYF